MATNMHDIFMVRSLISCCQPRFLVSVQTPLDKGIPEWMALNPFNCKEVN